MFDFSLLIGFILGIASSLIVKYTEIKFLQPDIKITDSVVIRRFNLTGENNLSLAYHANRIRIENEGSTAAENCKVYIEFNDDDIERTGWMLPDKNSGYTVTLNVKDKEYVDLCAIRHIGTNRLVSMEYGFTLGTVGSCRDLGDQQIDATLKVTSSNARIAKRKIRIYNTRDHFENKPGRIVGFLD